MKTSRLESVALTTTRQTLKNLEKVSHWFYMHSDFSNRFKYLTIHSCYPSAMG